MGKTVLELPKPEEKVLDLEPPPETKTATAEERIAALIKKSGAVESVEDLTQAVFDGLVLG